MLLCYVDESGTCEPYVASDPGSTPVFVIVGMTIASSQLKSLTMAYLHLKKEFEPTLAAADKTLSDLIRFEVKGSKIRKDIRADRGGRNNRRRALGFLDKTIRILEDHNARIIGKVIVKAEGHTLEDKHEYPRAVQELAVSLNSQAASSRSESIMILDSRTKVKNEGNVHHITTRKFRRGGDMYPYLHEAPVFGHSDTHVPLQIADLLASAIIFPVACLQYTADDKTNVHNSRHYQDIHDKFGARLAKLEHRYINSDGVKRGGFQVVDPVQRRATHLLFRD